jgi:hypothetical protein
VGRLVLMTAACLVALVAAAGDINVVFASADGTQATVGAGWGSAGS